MELVGTFIFQEKKLIGIMKLVQIQRVFCMSKQKYIMLADMNSFFASCSQSVDASLRNKPVIVGGSPTNKMKGMAIAASYEAKKMGVYTGLSMREALRKCPDAIVVQRNHPLYSSFSRKIMSFLRLIGDTEVASIDEAYVDITDRVLEGTSPKTIANYVRQTLWNKIHIPCSIGVGPSKIIAKMAADILKPMGYTELNREQFCSYFHPQPLHVLHGCGKKTTEKLNKLGLHTIGDLAKSNSANIKIMLGIRGEQLQKSALGISSDQVNADRQKGDKTIGKEKTFASPVNDHDLILSDAKNMIDLLCQSLEKKRLRARTIAIVFKKESGEASHSKSITLSEAVSQPEIIYSTVENLYDTHLSDVSLWLFGVRLSNFSDSIYVQLSFFDDLRYLKR
jgi:DNA polymerase-4